MANKKSSPSVIAVVGGQWGDEGKGKIIDFLAQDSQVVIRAQGGDNAGHTVVNSQGIFKLHLIPSGIFNPRTVNIIGPGTVINPNTLISELEALNKSKISTKNLQISEKAHLTLDFHIFLDGYQESLRGKNKIGTTKHGIGPTYVSKVKRAGLQARLLKNPTAFMLALKLVLDQEKQIFGSRALPAEFKPSYYTKLIQNWSSKLSKMVVNTDLTVQQALQNGSKILIEGAQGTLLDIDHGTYPFTTSSNTTVNGLLNGSSIPAIYLSKVYGIFKAYQTRVGSGGMPTELKSSIGQQIRKKAHEYGTTTGRPRRVGYFDGVAASYAHKINGFTDIVLTRLDILTGIGQLKLCRKYNLAGNTTFDFPSDDATLSACEAVYGEHDQFKPWAEDLLSIRRFRDLPLEAKKYVEAIAKIFKGARLSLIGVGPERESLIVL